MQAVELVVSASQMKLIGTLSFETVPELYARFKTVLQGKNDWTLDLSGVSYSDSSGLALLANCLRIVKKNEGTLSVIHLPLQIKKMADITGMNKLLCGGQKTDRPSETHVILSVSEGSPEQ